MTGSREDIRAFNRELVDRYYDEGESVAALAKASGRSTSTINKLIDLDRVQNGPRERKCKPRDPRIMIDKKPLSDRHGMIGLRVARYRAEKDLTPSAMGMLISVSRVQVRNMEIGSHDFTLVELERIAKVIGVSFNDLIALGRHIIMEVA